jgi:uncharacterized protein involved in exopolysaccharide biosynthesis
VELATTLLKSWWTIIAGACVGLSVALVVLQYTPEVYEARATIAADVKRLPQEFVRRTISEDLELQLRALKDAVLSPANLETVVAETFGAPTAEEQEAALMHVIVSNSRLNFHRSTRILSIFYKDLDPYRAADVANMLADLFVLENRKFRAESATMVRESVEKLMGDVEAELRQKRAELSQLLVEHVHELESERFGNEQRIRELREDLKKSERDLLSARNRLQVLEAQRTDEQPQTPPRQPVSTSGDAAVMDPRILDLEEELEEMLHRLTENHPDVAAKRRELERVRESTRSEESGSAPPEGSEPPIPRAAPSVPSLDIWETRLRAAQLEVSRLEAENRTIRRGLATHEGYLANTPLIQRQVDDLGERVRVLEAQSRGNLEKIEAARRGEQLEEEEFGNPFMITGLAGPPSVPVFPDRRRFLGAGAAGGLLLFVGPLLAWVFLRQRIMFEMSLRTLADVPVLASIPEIPTEASIRRKRRVHWRNFGLSFLSASMLCAVLALQYLDLI